MACQSFSTKYSFALNLRGKLVTFDRPIVMGILNITADSFFDANRVDNGHELLRLAGKMLDEGADILDIGGQSTRPGATLFPSDEEMKKVIPSITSIVQQFPDAIISCDTFYSSVAHAAVDAGAALINDVSAGSMDEKMVETVGKLSVPYILMHMQGTPQTMQQNPTYTDVVGDIIHFFSQKIIELRKAGVNDIILDPGFGFGKSLEHNYTILRRLDEFRIFGLPIMAGLSRKKMIQTISHTSVHDSLNATSSANTIALMNGACALRVHDVKEAVECVKVFMACLKNAEHY